MSMNGPHTGARRLHIHAWLIAALGLLVVIISVLLVGDARSASQGSELIAFTREDGIYVMRSDGSGVRALWHGRHAANLTWAPDGRTLAFDARRSFKVRSSIWVVDAQGAHLVRVVSSAASPTWSPDGRRIAFTRLGTPANENRYKRAIWVVNPDGSGMRRLLSLNRLGRDLEVSPGPNSLDWSPDGRRIVLSAYGGWLAWIYVVNVDGTHVRRLSERGWAWDDDPEWSPDGRKIAYFGTPGLRIGPNTSEILVTDPVGRSHLRLTRNWVGDESPTWSPDGSKIAFVRTRTSRGYGSSDIYVMNADGTGVTRLTRGHDHPAWQSVEVAWQPVATP
jgi:TolB protein